MKIFTPSNRSIVHLVVFHKCASKILQAFFAFIFFVGFFSSSYAQSSASSQFLFQDMGSKAGLFPYLAGIRGHGAGWGDVDGDGRIDLYVGTFNEDSSKLNMFFRNKGNKFVLDEQKSLQISTRATGVIFADLDNDGDLDLYIGSMPQPKNKILGNTLFRNEGGGVFTDISKGNEACPEAFGGRSATVLDYDGDGLLDLLAGEDPMPNYNGSKTKSSRLFRNKGNLQFEDASLAAGLPAGVPGYGVAAADVNNDGWPDFFLAANDGGNILFLNDKKGRFYESPGSRELFAWKDAGNSNMVCGITFGDVNRDGLLDIVLGPHFQKPWIVPQSIKLFLNRGIKNGIPNFVEITEASGLKPLPMKAPHVEIQDFDNDGWPDIYASIVKFKDGTPYPSIAKHMGIVKGVPQFREDAMAVNDFPTQEDKDVVAQGSTGKFFEKMIREKKIIYSAPGPAGDYDNDGKLDIFLPSWWLEAPSMLLHNETPGGNWLQIQVRGSNGVNLMGVGSRINIYHSGKLGNTSALLGCQEISVGYGYASGHTDIAHFGLGKEKTVDVEVILPNGKGKRVQKNVKANQKIYVK